MKSWVMLDQKSLNQPRREEIQGVEINVLLSPYDIPVAVRGQYDETIKRFIIEFKYIEDEPTKRDDKDVHIALRIGKNSGRIYGFEVDVDALRAKQIRLQMHVQNLVSKVIDDQLSRVPIGSPKHRNYDLAKGIIAKWGGRLFEDLPATVN